MEIDTSYTPVELDYNLTTPADNSSIYDDYNNSSDFFGFETPDPYSPATYSKPVNSPFSVQGYDNMYTEAGDEVTPYDWTTQVGTGDQGESALSSALSGIGDYIGENSWAQRALVSAGVGGLNALLNHSMSPEELSRLKHDQAMELARLRASLHGSGGGGGSNAAALQNARIAEHNKLINPEKPRQIIYTKK